MKKRKRGFITLMSVIVIGAVGTSVALTLLLLGTDSLRSTQNLFDSAKSRSYVDGCAEKALQTLRNNINYAGGETLDFPDGSCTILPIIGSGTQSPTIRSESAVAGTKRRAEVSVKQVSPQLKLNYWKEVADF